MASYYAILNRYIYIYIRSVISHSLITHKWILINSLLISRTTISDLNMSRQTENYGMIILFTYAGMSRTVTRHDLINRLSIR